MIKVVAPNMAQKVVDRAIQVARRRRRVSRTSTSPMPMRARARCASSTDRTRCTRKRSRSWSCGSTGSEPEEAVICPSRPSALERESRASKGDRRHSSFERSRRLRRRSHLGMTALSNRHAAVGHDHLAGDEARRRSDARNAATPPISSGMPMRRSGVAALRRFDAAPRSPTARARNRSSPGPARCS